MQRVSGQAAWTDLIDIQVAIVEDIQCQWAVLVSSISDDQ